MALKEKEVDWQAYYSRIKSVCPWSYNAYMKDKILVWPNAVKTIRTVCATFDSTDYEAFVYVFPNHTPSQLDDLVVALNQYKPKSEFLWSHPDADSGDGNSTEIPVIIQQNRGELNDLREKLNGE